MLLPDLPSLDMIKVPIFCWLFNDFVTWMPADSACVAGVSHPKHTVVLQVITTYIGDGDVCR